MRPAHPTTRCGIIFDLDGTLADTLDDLTRAVNHAVRDARSNSGPDVPAQTSTRGPGVSAREALSGPGVPARTSTSGPGGSARQTAPLTPDEIKLMIGEGLATLIARASGSKDEERIASMVAAFRAFYGDHLLDATKLYAGIADVVAALANRGVAMAVLSNKPHDFTQRIVRGLLPDAPFVSVRGMSEGVPRKPDPAAALEIYAQMRLVPDHVCFVGDSAIDVETAHRGGMTSVGVTWGFRDRAELESAGAKFVIRDPTEILNIVDGLLR